jgi:phosphoglycerate dehydrogenase-like enzyme
MLIIVLGPGAGPDAPQIDLEAARAAGIYVTSIPDAHTSEWANESLELLNGALHLAGRTEKPLRDLRLGIIGFGQVGREVARLAGKQGARLWAHDPFSQRNPYDVFNVQSAPLEEILGIAQAVSLHVPLGPATRGMLNRKRLSWLQTGSVLVNTASPRLIDLEALAMSLKRGKPAAVAFNTDLATILPPDHPLLSAPNLIHRAARAGTGPEADKRLVSRAQEIIKQTWNGNRPKHLLIDPPCPRHALWIANSLSP